MFTQIIMTAEIALIYLFIESPLWILKNDAEAFYILYENICCALKGKVDRFKFVILDLQNS